LRNIAEQLGRHGQLAASARVRSNRADVEMADRDGEALLGRGGQAARVIDLLGIVIDVGVKIANAWLGHGAPYSDVEPWTPSPLCRASLAAISARSP